MKSSLKAETDLSIKPINQGSVPESVLDDPKVIAKQRWKDLQFEESKMVKGKFIYHECPGGVLEFSFRKFKGIPLKNYTMKDGESYEIPLAVARHLNNNVSYPSHTFKNDEAGRPVSQIAEMVRRTSFQSLDFF